MYIHREKQLSYSMLQGIRALVKNKGFLKKINYSYALCIYIHMLSVIPLSKEIIKKRKTGIT